MLLNKGSDFLEGQNELGLVIFLIHSLSDAWCKKPVEVYDILMRTDVLDGYIVPCYDTLHTLGKEYLIEDITEFVREKGELV